MEAEYTVDHAIRQRHVVDVGYEKRAVDPMKDPLIDAFGIVRGDAVGLGILIDEAAYAHLGRKMEDAPRCGHEDGRAAREEKVEKAVPLVGAAVGTLHLGHEESPAVKGAETGAAPAAARARHAVGGPEAAAQSQRAVLEMSPSADPG
jgi:hypothetical protein